MDPTRPKESGVVKVLLVVLVGMILAALLVGCDEVAQPPAGGGGDPFLAGANAQATLEFAQAARKATQEARANLAIEMTAQAAFMESQAQATATSQIATAAAGTAQAIATMDNLAAQATAQDLSFQATAQAGNLLATAQARAFDDQERALALERARTSNMVKALFWYAAAAIAVLLIAFAIYQRARVVYYRRGPRGEVGVMVIDGKTLLLPELAPTPVTRFHANEAIEITPEQMGVKTNQQKIEALRAMGPQPARSNVNPWESGTHSMGPQLPAQIEQVRPEVVVEILDEVEAKLLEDPE